MKKLNSTLFTLLAILAASCGERRSGNGLQLAPADSVSASKSDNNASKPLQAIVYGDIDDLDSTDYMLIPLGMRTIAARNTMDVSMKSYYESDDRSYSSSSKYNFRSLTMSNCNNVIFYNKLTEETHLLLKQPAIISRFYFPAYSDEYKGTKFYFLLFGIRDHDSNGDGYINDIDAEKVFMSDLSGKNMSRLTPDNTQLLDWFIDIPTNNILMYVRTNSHADKVFDVKDEIIILKSSITKPGMGKEIINAEIKESIKKILGQIK